MSESSQLYKNINLIKKYIGLYILFFTYSAILLINLTESVSMDEIWCFGFSRRIAEGYIPYKDYNIVTTPLFFFIGALFSKNLLIFRLYGALTNATVALLTYYHCEKNNINKQLSIVITFVVSILLLGQYANYNYLLLAGIMVSYLFTIKFFNEMNSKNSFLLGLSFSIILLIKQNIPAVLIIIFTCIIIALLIKQKISFIIFANYALGGVTPIVILILYLLANGALFAFIDYTVLGLNSFLDNIAYENRALFGILPTIIITLFVFLNLIKTENNKLINYSTLVYSLISYILIFPIINMIHSIILLIFNIFLLIPYLEAAKLKSKYINVTIYFSYIMYLIICLSVSKGDYVRSENQIYKNILFTKITENNIKLISEYIINKEEEGFDVALINEYAYLYTIPANDNNGVLDLLSIGNVGTLSDEDITGLIDRKDIILTNDYFFYQDIKEVREYVYENYIEVDKIGNMSIYVKRYD